MMSPPSASITTPEPEADSSRPAAAVTLVANSPTLCLNVRHSRRDLFENCDESSIDLFGGLKRRTSFGCPASYNCSGECECSGKSVHSTLLDGRKDARLISVTALLKPIMCWFRDRPYEEAHQDGVRRRDQHA